MLLVKKILIVFISFYTYSQFMAVAHITAIKGDVKLNDEKIDKVGAEIYSGVKLETFVDAMVEIDFQNGHHLQINADTTAQFGEINPKLLSFHLSKGKAMLQVAGDKVFVSRKALKKGRYVVTEKGPTRSHER